MNLLLTNDDGYGSEGLSVLAQKLSQEHNVFIIAPDGNRSAISHGITMYKKNKVKLVEKNVWTCSGTPVDCVITALKSDILPTRPDGILSGINKGANLGTDIVYSGTCAAAREGVIEGIPSVAFSLEYVDNKLEYFDVLADFASKNIEKLLMCSDVQKEKTFVNVNAFSYPNYKGIRAAKILESRSYDDFIEYEDKDTFLETSFRCGSLNHAVREDSDFDIAKKGFVSISKVYALPMASEVVDCNQFSL